MGSYVELLRACKDGNFKKVKKLLTTCKNITDVRDLSNRTLLHYCFQYEQCFDLIMEVAPELLNIGENSGYTVLHLASKIKSETILRYILSKNPDINKRTNDLRTPLLLAVIHDNCEAVRILCDAHAEVNVTDCFGESPLHYICKAQSDGEESNHIDIIDILLQYNADIDIHDSIERTPLIYAISSKNKAKMLHLLSRNANINARDVCKLSILHYAVSTGDMSIIDILISEFNYDIESIDNNNRTSLMYACTMGTANVASGLIELGANVNAEDSKKRNPVHFVCSKGDLDILKILEENNGNIWHLDEDGNLPLHEASFNGHDDIVKYFLSQNTTGYINQRNVNGITPFHLAVYKEHVTTCGILLEYGADPNIPVRAKCGTFITPLDLSQNKLIKDLIRQYRGKTADELFTMCPIVEDVEESNSDEDYNCCDHKHRESIQEICVEDVQEDRNNDEEDCITDVTEAMRNLIIESCYRGNIDMIKSMVGRGVCLGDIVDDCGKNLLHYSLKSREILTLIRDIVPHCVNIPDKYGTSVLNLAIMSHENDNLSLLLECGSDVNFSDDCGRTSLHLAILYNNIEALVIINKMVKHRSDIYHKADRKGKFPIHYSVELFQRFDSTTVSREFVEILLAMNADVESKDSLLRTPLMLAVKVNNVEAVKVLLEHGADLVAKDCNGLSCIHYACLDGHMDIVTMLAKCASYDPNVEDHSGLTPLYYAVTNSNENIVRHLIDQDVRVDIVSDGGKNLCHEAVERGALTILQLLLSRNVNPWRPSNDGMTSLHKAALQGHKEIAEILVTLDDAQEHVNVKNKLDQAALHLAALRNDCPMCLILIGHGCNVNELSWDKVTEIRSTAYDLSTSEHCRDTLYSHGGRSARRRMNSIIVEENIMASEDISIMTTVNHRTDIHGPVIITGPAVPRVITDCSRNNSRKCSLTIEAKETSSEKCTCPVTIFNVGRERPSKHKVIRDKKRDSVKSVSTMSNSVKSSTKKSPINSTRIKTQNFEGKVHSSVFNYEFVRLNSKITCDCVRMQIRRENLKKLLTSNSLK